MAIGDIHVVRNAGGNAVDALRSVGISQQLLGTTEVYLVKHTDCGMLTFTNDGIHRIIKENVRGMGWGAWGAAGTALGCHHGPLGGTGSASHPASKTFFIMLTELRSGPCAAAGRRCLPH